MCGVKHIFWGQNRVESRAVLALVCSLSVNYLFVGAGTDRRFLEERDKGFVRKRRTSAGREQETAGRKSRARRALREVQR